MDERTYHLIVLILVLGITAVFLQPILELQLDTGFWAFLGGIVAYLGSKGIKND